MSLTVVQLDYAWEIHVNLNRWVINLQAYLRFADIYYIENNCAFAKTVTGGALPYVEDGNVVVCGENVIEYLSRNVLSLDFCEMQYTNLDLDYSETDRAEIAVYSYILKTVGNAIFVQFIIW